MADTVPVSEVLCDAMEYLSKLGSNLRVRSENLKEKRLRKGKLRNTHAVQKAVQKVLMICELSKKSILNVENGVKKILSQIDATQGSTSFGAEKNKVSSKSDTNINFEYFIYDSRKLKIRNKVNIKHYTSVKVLSKALPSSMIDNNPVYYDCKLYRRRKRAMKTDYKENILKECSNEESSANNVNKDANLDINKGDETKILKQKAKSKDEECVANNDDINADKSSKVYLVQKDANEIDKQNDVVKRESENKEDKSYTDVIKRPTAKRSKKFRHIRAFDSSDSDTERTQVHESSTEVGNKTKKDSDKETNKSDCVKEYNKEIPSIPSSLDTHDIVEKVSSDCKESLPVRENGTSNQRAENSLGDNKNKITLTNNKHGITLSENIEHSTDGNNKTNSKNDILSTINKAKQHLINSNSENSHADSNEKDKSTNKASNQKETEKTYDTPHIIEKEFNSNKESNENSNNSKPNDNEIKLSENENSQSSEGPKTFLKCVNINKLLREDKLIERKKNEISVEIIESDSDIELKHKRKKNKDKDKKLSKSKKINKNNIQKLKKCEFNESSQSEDKDFWKQKRKEVKKFNPKEFVINITRLPKLTEKYLQTYQLHRITQNGCVICSLSLQDYTENEPSKLAEKGNNEVSNNDLNVFKNALLNDSNSDHEKETDKTNEIKKALVESHSENEEKVDWNSPICEESDDNKKNSGLDCGKDKIETTTKEISEHNDATDRVTTSLHQSSGDENLKTPNKKRKRRCSSTPPSKRKHIMESMHAKKMLLTYSSSSETDDEQLRSVLKKLRDSLLKECSDENDDLKSDKVKKSLDFDESDLEENKKKLRRKRLASSSSEEKKVQKAKTQESDTSTKDTNSQVDENADEQSNSSSVKMGCPKSKPSVTSSSSQNTDTQESYDKEIDGLTNLKSLTKKHRRRRQSPSTDCTQSTISSKSKEKMPKRFTEDALLKAESSSDAASIADSDVGEEVEIPADGVVGLNGDSIGRLAKDDLLEESDTSDTPDKSSQDIKTEADDSDEDNVKLRRRKANAISSDSEVGGSRKKDRNVKLSDFEDSDDDSSSEPKKSKRKKKGNDSDSSSGSLDGSKKKRRRIKNIDDSDDVSGSESETEGRNKHGRKNIRKVMGKSQLEEATKKAAREEKERIARIAERQKLYNNLQFDESGKPDEVVLDKVVLDFDPETKEPLIEVDKGLVKKLKPHQANGIKFMWDACFESVKRIKKDKGSGCILAHCMGLGKTLQVVSLTHTLLTHSALTKVNRVLVVCPLSTVLNWVNEYRIWLKHAHKDFEVDVYELSRHKQNSERAWQLQQWFTGGGVCVLGYEMFRNLSADNVKKFKKKMLKSFQESLVDPGPDLVVCDEGHLLKNEKTSLSQAMNRVKTLRRIVLTGTPLQNNLKEYYCMVQFVKPNLLGKYNEYLNRFVNPITNGQYTDSTEHDIKIMKRRSHVLHKMLDGAVQRRDYGVLAPFLPPKHEYVLFITLTEVQIKLYQHYLDNYSRRPSPGKSSGFLFPDFQSLQRIWTHPLVLKYNSERYEIMQQKKREREEEDSEGSLADFINDDSTPDETSTEESSDSLSDASDDSRKKSKKKKSSKKNKDKDSKVSTRRGTRANPVEVDDDEVTLADESNVKSENPTEWWMALVSDDELDDLRHSHKLVLLFDILKHCEAIGDKLLVFSQSLYSLDLIEHFLGKVDEATQEARVDEKLNGHMGSWSPGVDYFRLDGSTSCENRSIWCKNFNREDNPRARLFLISTRAGGLGINLVAANRVVIFDVSWNPSHDVQSIFRVYRFGQKKPCYVYRFLAMGTMEEKIYERQVTKQAISKRVIDEQQIDRHYAENDLAELYKFEPHPPVPRELPPLPKDRLFAEMLKEHEAQIYKYHEHDSLLENKEEETLTEEERKAAWEDFENEKTRPPPAPFSAYMHNGMLFAQQQQQLAAYAMIAGLLQKEMPNATHSQIQEVLSRTNPAMFGGYDYGMMQKLNELYKYPQAGMMNPAMMNSIMNPGSVGGVGMGLGGSSGLQYEPPWQRQQKLQQQYMQMQQRQQMLNQNSMGAKFYAGGLGSRDPVAMQEQQQRARAMMLGERSRPRGRPPAPRPDLPMGPADVVNLDSD